MAQTQSDEDVGQLVTRYARLIHSAVVRVAGPAAADIADDVEQRVALNLLRRSSSEQEIVHPASYLYRTAVRETVRAVREERRREQMRAPLEDLEIVDASSPMDVYDSRRIGTEIMKAIATLEPKRGQAVRAHLAGFSVREIMEMQRWTYNTARNLIARGMADLRSALRKRGIHE